MNLLMHICCANCSIHPLQSLLLKDVRITGLWFNPNIHPYTEYTKRLEALKKLQKLWAFEVEYLDRYPLDDFLKAITGRGPDRCSVCYRIRLEKTAETARQMGMDGFTTSLLASPYQKFAIINELGNELASKYGIAFYTEDFRKGWHLSRPVSMELELYRQKYCGCIYSEMERYKKKEKVDV